MHINVTMSKFYESYTKTDCRPKHLNDIPLSINTVTIIV